MGGKKIPQLSSTTDLKRNQKAKNKLKSKSEQARLNQLISQLSQQNKPQTRQRQNRLQNFGGEQSDIFDDEDHGNQKMQGITKTNVQLGFANHGSHQNAITKVGSEEELLQDEDEEDYKFKDESEEAFQPEEVISGAELQDSSSTDAKGTLKKRKASKKVLKTFGDVKALVDIATSKKHPGHKGGRTTILPQIQILLHPDLPETLKQQCASILQAQYDNNISFINNVELYRYQHVRKKMDKVTLDYTYFEQAQEFLNKGLNEFAYALNYRWKDFKTFATQQVKHRVSKDFYSLMETRIKTNLKQWTSETYDHQICFIEILCQGPVIIALEKNVETFIIQAMSKQQIASVSNLIHNLLKILDKSFQKQILQSSFKLKPELADSVMTNPSQIMSYDCIQLLQDASETTSVVLMRIQNIDYDKDRLNQFLTWVRDNRFLQIIERIFNDQGFLDFNELNKYIPGIYETFRVNDFQEYFNKYHSQICTMAELANLLVQFSAADKKFLDPVNDKRVNGIAIQGIFDQTGKKLTETELLVKQYLSSFESYSSSSKICGLYEWQKSISCATLYLFFNQNSNVLVEVPTGHGKSVLICAIAQAIYDLIDDAVIYITTKTSYLKYTLFQKHGNKNISVEFPSQRSGQERVVFIRFDEISQLKQHQWKNAIFIVDEIDQSFLDHDYDIIKEGEDKRKFIYHASDLFKAKRIIGFTGSLSEPAQDIITVDRRNFFKTLKFPNLSPKQQNQAPSVISYTGLAAQALILDRQKKIIQEVLRYTQEGKSVIIIDEHLKLKEPSFVSGIIKQHPVFVFKDFKKECYDQIQDDLLLLLEADKPVVVHTDLTGNRGVDFKFMDGRAVGVILAFEPKSSVDLIQGEGRGNRSIKQSASVTLVVQADSQFANLRQKTPLEKLQSKEKQERVQEQQRAKLLQRLHLEYLHCWITCDKPPRHYEEEYLYDIFKKRYNIFHEEGENEEVEEHKDGKNACDRWKETCMTFKWAKLPELVTNFFQEPPKQVGQVGLFSPNPSMVANRSGSAEPPEKRKAGRPTKQDKAGGNRNPEDKDE